MKIRSVAANNRREAFEIETEEGRFAFPYARLRLRPGAKNRITEVFADPELGHEAFTYVLDPRAVAEALDALAAEGRGWIAATTLDGRRVLRVTLINPRTEVGHLEAMMVGVRGVGSA